MNSRLDWLVLSDYYSIYITNAPPQVNCTHPRENEKCVQFFFLHECFSAIIPFEKPKIENPSQLNWINLQRVEHGKWMKKSVD